MAVLILDLLQADDVEKFDVELGVQLVAVGLELLLEKVLRTEYLVKVDELAVFPTA